VLCGVNWIASVWIASDLDHSDLNHSDLNRSRRDMLAFMHRFSHGRVEAHAVVLYAPVIEDDRRF
jgi:hypothetical protein